MRKRIISVLLTLAMVMTMLPSAMFTSSAEGLYDYTLVLKDGKAYENSVADENEVTVEGLSYSDGIWTMNNLNFTTTKDVAVKFADTGTSQSAVDIKINVIGTNNIESGSASSGYGSVGIVTGDYTNTVISGNGVLNVISGETTGNVPSTGVSASGSLTFQGPTAKIESAKAKDSYSIALYSLKDINVKSGAVMCISGDAKSMSYGIMVNGNIYVSGTGSITAKCKDASDKKAVYSASCPEAEAVISGTQTVLSYESFSYKNGSDIAVDVTMSAKPVACVDFGTDVKKYHTVQDAVNAAAENISDIETARTVKLLLDTKENIKVSDGDFVNIDLNGHVLSGTGSGSVITNEGTLNILDSDKASKHYFNCSKTEAWTLNNEAKEAVEGTVAEVDGGCIAGGSWGIFNSGNLLLHGGNIIGNAAAYGGGVFNSGNLVIKGDTSIKDNTSGGESSDLAIVKGHPVTMDNFTGDAIGVSIVAKNSQDEYEYTAGDVTTYGNADYIDKFTSDCEKYEVYKVGKKVVLASHCIYKANIEEGDNQLIFINDKRAGEFTVEEACGGFSIKKGDLYIAVSADGKSVVEQEDAYIWKYDGGLYTETKKASCRCWFWGKNKTTVNKLYLSYDGENLLLSKDKTEAYIEKTAVDHAITYEDSNDGTHNIICSRCGTLFEFEEHEYDPDTHSCVCGKIDPDECYVSDVYVSELKETVKKSAICWFGKKKVSNKLQYKYVITAKTKYVETDKIEYSLNGQEWKTGCTIKADNVITKIYIRITDSEGAVTYWTYEEDTVSKAEL